MKKILLAVLSLLLLSNTSHALVTGVRSGDLIQVSPREFYGEVGDRIILNCTDPYDVDTGSYPEGTHIAWSWACKFLEWNVEASHQQPYFVFDAKGAGEGILQVYLENDKGIAYSDYCYVKISPKSSGNNSDGSGGGGCNNGFIGFAFLGAVILLKTKHIFAKDER